jgi:hypothetical protein
MQNQIELLVSFSFIQKHHHTCENESIYTKSVDDLLNSQKFFNFCNIIPLQVITLTVNSDVRFEACLQKIFRT